jgi:hypothetical protein
LIYGDMLDVASIIKARSSSVGVDEDAFAMISR